MKKVFRKYFLLFILAVFVFGCTDQDTKESSFKDIYSECEMNTVLKISLQRVEHGNTFTIEMLMENLSTKDVISSYNSNLKLWSFHSSENEWNDVLNNVDNLGSDVIIVNAKDYSVVPIYPLANINDEIRVAITGTYYENGLQGNECIGAFADYTITP